MSFRSWNIRRLEKKKVIFENLINKQDSNADAIKKDLVKRFSRLSPKIKKNIRPLMYAEENEEEFIRMMNSLTPDEIRTVYEALGDESYELDRVNRLRAAVSMQLNATIRKLERPPLSQRIKNSGFFGVKKGPKTKFDELTKREQELKRKTHSNNFFPEKQKKEVNAELARINKEKQALEKEFGKNAF